MLCIIFSVGFSLRLLKGSYLFPEYSENIVNPLAELLGSFERNHRVTRRPLNPLFSDNFFTNIAISEVHNASLEDIWTHGWLGYDVIHHSWTLVWFARCFVAFISRYRYHVLRVRVCGRGFLPSPGLPNRSFPFFFAIKGWKIWVPLIFNGFHTRFRGCPANFMSAAMLWKARLCFLPIDVRITFEQNTKSC